MSTELSTTVNPTEFSPVMHPDQDGATIVVRKFGVSNVEVPFNLVASMEGVVVQASIKAFKELMGKEFKEHNMTNQFIGLANFAEGDYGKSFGTVLFNNEAKTMMEQIGAPGSCTPQHMRTAKSM